MLDANETTSQVNEQAIEASTTTGRSEKSRAHQWVERLITFSVGQGILQAINVTTGFLLIRWLSVNEYAAYSLVTGFQGTVGILAELGLGNSIIAILRGRTDPRLMGGYIRSIRHYRTRFTLTLLPLVAVAFIGLTSRQNWSPSAAVLIFLAILTTLHFQSWATYYSVPLLLKKDLRTYYYTPTALGAGRLASSFILHATSLLTSVTAVWLASALIVAQGCLYKAHSSRYITEPRDSDLSKNREILAYIRPLLPSTIFFAIQGQIGIFLITWFGKLQNIAEVGALGRIAQIFTMLARIFHR